MERGNGGLASEIAVAGCGAGSLQDGTEGQIAGLTKSAAALVRVDHHERANVRTASVQQLKRARVQSA